MAYFIFRVFLALFLSLALMLGFVRLLLGCRKERCDKPWQVFWPTLLALLFVVQVLYSSAPKLLDCVAALRGAYAFRQVQVADRQSFPGVLKTEDGARYAYNPFELDLEKGGRYNISYTPWEKYIIKIDKVNH